MGLLARTGEFVAQSGAPVDPGGTVGATAGACCGGAWPAAGSGGLVT
jgi:hypothetical protein